MAYDNHTEVSAVVDIYHALTDAGMTSGEAVSLMQTFATVGIALMVDKGKPLPVDILPKPSPRTPR